jgi:hypothetical protein
MSYETQIGLSVARKERKAHAVRFPYRTVTSKSSFVRFLNFWNLLPRGWRRRVVIRGRHFWLPG